LADPTPLYGGAEIASLSLAGHPGYFPGLSPANFVAGPATVPEGRRVAIVILTWNALKFTRHCLKALRDVTDHPSWRIVVVDNGSTDGTVEWLESLPWVALAKNQVNLGFSRACNIGIAMTEPDEDVVLLNNDVIVTDPQWLSHLQAVAHSDPAIGVVGTRLVDSHGRINHLGSYMPPLTLRGHQIGGRELDINQCTRDRFVECVVFAQAFLRRECLDRVGSLDEDLFAYFEDTDYCLRASRAGFKVVYAGSVCSVHHHNTTTRENGVDFWSIYERSRKVFSRKWADWLDRSRYDGEVAWQSVIDGPVSYAMHSRKMMQALHFAGLRVSYRNVYGDSDQTTDDELLNDLMRRRPNPYARRISYSSASAFKRAQESRLQVGWTMLEVTGMPRDWVAGCNAMDEVWVPSSFNVETFRAGGVKVPIRVMPLGVDIDYFHPNITASRASDRFTFLSVFEWGPRKNPEMLLRAFTEEFTKADDVMLLLSITNRDPSVNVRHEIERLELPDGPPMVVMVNPGFSEYQMGALYRSADCFVLPTRGEGWGMPVLEAMACGLPAIATSYGGPADYLHDDIGYPLNVRSLVPARGWRPYHDGFEWAEPDDDHLRFRMREVFDRPEKAHLRGLAAAAEVASNYTWEHAARRVKQRILELW